MKKIKYGFKRFIRFITGVKSDNWAYELISFLGVLFRIIGLPFIVSCAYKAAVTKYFGDVIFPIWAVEIITRGLVLLSSFFFSTRLINKMAYVTVGNFYSRGKKPELGSFFYNFFYVFYQLMPIFLFGPFGWLGYGATAFLYFVVCSIAYGVCSPLPKEMQVTPELKNVGTYPSNWIIRMVLHWLITVLVIVGAGIFQWFVYNRLFIVVF